MKSYDGKVSVDIDLQALTPADIRSVYSGRDGRCCCGCSGKHYYASKLQAEASKDRGYDVSDDELSDKMVVRVLRNIQANPDEAYAEPRSHIAVVVGKRLYIAYFTNAFNARS